MSGSCPVFGFDVVLTPCRDLDLRSLRALREDFLRLALEAEGLEAAGCDGGEAAAGSYSPGSTGDDAAGWRFTISRCGSQAIEMDRAAIARWLGARPGVAGYELGPLVDLGRTAW